VPWQTKYHRTIKYEVLAIMAGRGVRMVQIELDQGRTFYATVYQVQRREKLEGTCQSAYLLHATLKSAQCRYTVSSRCTNPNSPDFNQLSSGQQSGSISQISPLTL